MSGGRPTRDAGAGPLLDCTLLYRTFRSVCAFRGLTAKEGAHQAQVPYSALCKLSPTRSQSQQPPTADNLLRMLLWMDPDCDLAQYALDTPDTTPEDT